MERDEKIQLLLDMQEHPEQFSEQALQTMLDDPEVRELMEATAQLKQAMISEEFLAEPSGIAERKVKSEEFATADLEWQHFAQTHLTEQKPERSWLKIAAAFIGILMMSGIAFAAIHIWSLTPAPSPKGEGSEYNIMSDTTRQSSPLPSKGAGEAAPIRYDEATLEQILTDMADYYGLTLNWKSEDAKTLRLFYIWNKQQSAVETIKSMNSFERIRLELNDSILTADIQTNNPKQ